MLRGLSHDVLLAPASAHSRAYLLSKGEIAYTIVETNVAADGEILDRLRNIEGVFGVRTFA